MSKVCKVYGLYSTEKPKDIRYVGQTVQKVETRFRSHLYDVNRVSKRRPLLDWIKNVQRKGFRVEFTILNQKATWEKSEKFLIKKLSNQGYKLLNLTDGGEGTLGWIPSKKWRANISKINTGRKWNKKRRQRHSEYMKKNHPLRGKKMSLESRKKMSIAKLGKVLPHMFDSPSNKTKRKIGAATKKRLSIQGHPLKGKPMSILTKQKISQSLLRYYGKN